MPTRPLERPWWQLTTRASIGLAIGLGGIAVAVILVLLMQAPVAWYQIAVAGFWAVVGPGFLISALAQVARERRLARSATERPGTFARPRPADDAPETEHPDDDLDDAFVPVPIRPAGLRRRGEMSRVPEGRGPDDRAPDDRAPDDRAIENPVDPSVRTDTIVGPAAPGAPGTRPGRSAPTPTTGPVRLPGNGTSGGAARPPARPTTPRSTAPARRPTPPMSVGPPAAPAPPAPRASVAEEPASQRTTDPLADPEGATPGGDPEGATPGRDPEGATPGPLPHGRHSAPQASPRAPRARSAPDAQSPQSARSLPPEPSTDTAGARHRSPSPEDDPRARHGAPPP